MTRRGEGRMQALIERLDRWQRRRRWTAFVVAVGVKYTRDRAGRHGARLAYYAFFSLFPLLMAFVSILGFILQGDPALRQEILDSTVAEMPVIGPFVRSDIGTIGGSGVALAAGILVALWAGLAVTVAFGQALDEIYEVPRDREVGYVGRHVRGLILMTIVGVTIVASSFAGGAAITGRLGDAGSSVAAVMLSLTLDGIALLAAFRLLTAARPRIVDLLPGVVLAMAGLFVLQTLGGWYVDATISRASDTYGLFATVIGLLSWLSLSAQLLLIAAEVNTVYADRGSVMRSG